MKSLILALVGATLAVGARADVVHLTNGRQLEGRATVEKDQVKVQIIDGWVFLQLKEVASIEKKDSPLDVYEHRRAALEPKDVAGRLELAAWCRTQGLNTENQELLREVLALDTDNAQARALLGYAKYDGKWMTEEEHNRSLGLVLFEGQWLKPEAVEAVLKARAQAQQQAAAGSYPPSPPPPPAYTAYSYDYPYDYYYPYYYPPVYYSWPAVVVGGGFFFHNGGHHGGFHGGFHGGGHGGVPGGVGGGGHGGSHGGGMHGR